MFVGVGVNQYTRTIYRKDVSNLCYLLHLVVNGRGVSMSPSFSRTTMFYNVSVARETSSVTVTPTSENPEATILLNDTYTISSGNISPELNLDVGNNIITIRVMMSGSSQIYTITVSRPS